MNHYYLKTVKLLSLCCVSLLLLSCLSNDKAAQSPSEYTPKTPVTGSIDNKVENTADKESEAEVTFPENIVPESEETVESEISESTDAEDISESTDTAEPSSTDSDDSELTEKTEDIVDVYIPELSENVHTNISDPQAIAILDEIYRTINESTDAAVYFADVEEEFFFGISENDRYHSASTIKAVYCNYLIKSGTDLNTEVLYSVSTRSSSSGHLGYDDVGKKFTVSKLIEYSIRYSDNQAYRLLYDTFGTDWYNQYVSALGDGGLILGDELEWADTSAKKLSYAMLDIYRFSNNDSTLIDHLKNTTFNKQIAAGTSYDVAHKYGSNGGNNGYHDTAIVYAENRPYVLTILTHVDIDKTADYNSIFREVTELCDKLHSVLYN